MSTKDSKHDEQATSKAGTSAGTATSAGAKTDAKTDSRAAARAEKLKDSDQAKTDHPTGLASAGQSGDPVVQKLLAERQGHVMNAGIEHDPEVEARQKAAREAIEKIDDELAELGYTAK